VEKELARFAACGSEEAISVLTELNSVSAIDGLDNAIMLYDFEKLGDVNPVYYSWLFAAAEHLSKHKRALPLLFIYANHPDAAFDALQQLGHEQIIQTLREILTGHGSDIEMRRKWARIMEKVAEKAFYSNSAAAIAVGVVAKQLGSDPDEEIKQTSKRCLESLSRLQREMDEECSSPDEIGALPF
jgi:hypothetical protein